MRYLAFLAIILIAGAAFAAPKLKKINLTKEISIKLPKDFTPMSDDDIAREYPATTKPLAVYTSPDGNIDFSLTQKRTTFRERDLTMLREFYKANLVETFTNIDFIRQEVTAIDGKQFIVFEFVSNLADTRGASNLKPVQKYSIIMYTITGNQLQIYTLHIPFQLKNQWQDTAREIMGSVNIKK
ncbi:hypothetical protein [Pontibacter sp. Tf4]|uniref:hypothetical protein n=1 Tax=Pontibacter sp. Tf4 TaxID=2761620 RepID=UPI002102AD36|nr:hypothetical protein [Pontibacter sp. Tf4]